LNGRWDGGEAPAALASLPSFGNPTIPSKNMVRMGDEGKAVGCVPPTALLSERCHEWTKEVRYYMIVL
jgi:hypothetical protein